MAKPRIQRWAGAACVCAGLVGCADRLTPPPADLTPPSFDVVFPTADSYDRDGDALVDFEISWSDIESAVDPATFAVRALDGVNGAMDGSANVLNGWRVERRDSSGIVFHETLDNLMREGVNRLELSVSDRAGNRRVDTITVALPAAALMKSIAADVPASWSARARGMVVCPDDHRVYVTIGKYISVFDGDSLHLVGSYPHSPFTEQLNQPHCVAGEQYVYVTYAGLARFDRVAMQWVSNTNPPFGSYGIARSFLNPDLIYVGENAGYVGIINRHERQRIGAVAIPRDSIMPREEFFDLAMLPGDRKLYITRYTAGGIMAVNPQTGEVLNVIDLDPETEYSVGRSNSFELSADARTLYVAITDGVPRGVVELNTETDRPMRRWGTADDVPQSLSLSPSGNRLFITTQDRTSEPSDNVLLDLREWRVAARFKRQREPGQLRLDGASAFHPDGKLIFVGRGMFYGDMWRDFTLDVYINRE